MTPTAGRRAADPALQPIYCPRCRTELFRAVLSVGSVVQFRCHQTIRGADGKRTTCGFVARVLPTR